MLRSDPSKGPLVECAELTKRYGVGGASTDALADVDLDIDAGELVAVVGPSGSGKSTLLHLVGAMDRPTSGTVRVDGFELGRLSDREAARFRRKHVGFVFQFFNLVPTLTVLDNVALPARLAGERAATARDRAASWLERVGLGDRIGSHPDALSGGQQQRVAIARSLVNEPPIVLADEPTGALDRRTGEEVLSLLVELVRAHERTLVVATHDEMVMTAASRVVRIEDGRVVAEAAAP